MDVRALGSEGDWYVQDWKQWLNVCEQICAINYDGGLCAANRPSLDGPFCIYVQILLGVLEILLDIRTSAVASTILIILMLTSR